MNSISVSGPNVKSFTSCIVATLHPILRGPKTTRDRCDWSTWNVVCLQLLQVKKAAHFRQYMATWCLLGTDMGWQPISHCDMGWQTEPCKLT